MARPTALDRVKAELGDMRDTLSQKDADLEHLGETLRELEADRDRWRAERLSDPEAEALAGCLRAFEQMDEQERARAARVTNAYANTMGSPRWASLPPSPLESPVGRVLLHLAARYGIPLEAKVPEPIPEPGRRLMSLPAELAEQLEQMGPLE